MSTMTDDREKMQEHLSSLLERAESTDEDWALTSEAPLSLEGVVILDGDLGVRAARGKQNVDVLSGQAAEYWFENDPQGAWFTFMDWGTREDKYVGRQDAYSIMQAITRDPDELGEADTES